MLDKLIPDTFSIILSKLEKNDIKNLRLISKKISGKVDSDPFVQSIKSFNFLKNKQAKLQDASLKRLIYSDGAILPLTRISGNQAAQLAFLLGFIALLYSLYTTEAPNTGTEKTLSKSSGILLVLLLISAGFLFAPDQQKNTARTEAAFNKEQQAIQSEKTQIENQLEESKSRITQLTRRG